MIQFEVDVQLSHHRTQVLSTPGVQHSHAETGERAPGQPPCAPPPPQRGRTEDRDGVGRGAGASLAAPTSWRFGANVLENAPPLLSLVLLFPDFHKLPLPDS